MELAEQNVLLSKGERMYPLLSQEDVVSAVENGATEALVHLFKCPASVAWTPEGLVMQLFKTNRMVLVDIASLSKSTKRHLFWCIEKEMMRLNTLAEYEQYRMYRGTIVYGEVSSVRKSGSLNIWLNLDRGGLTAEQRMAHYSFKHQPIKERWKYSVGEFLSFYVSSVVPITGEGGSSHVRINLSRTALEMPKVMLENLQNVNIEIISRIPGWKTVLRTDKKIEKKHVIAVSRELKESLSFLR